MTPHTTLHSLASLASLLLLIGCKEPRPLDEPADAAVDSADSGRPDQAEALPTGQQNTDSLAAGQDSGIPMPGQDVDAPPAAPSMEAGTAAPQPDSAPVVMDAASSTPPYVSTLSRGPAGGSIQDVAVANDGSMFVAGTFKGTVDFNPGPATDGATAQAGGDVFVTKFNPDGGYAWTRTIPSDQQEPTVGLHAGPAGEVFLRGEYKGAADFYPGEATAKRVSQTTWNEGYVLKLRADGSFGYLRTFAGTGDSGISGGQAMPDGSLAVGGHFGGPIDFGNGEKNEGVGGGYVAMLGPGGALSWVRLFPDSPEPGHVNVQEVCLGTAGEIWVAGTLSGTMDLDPGAGLANRSVGAGQSLFVGNLDSTGKFLRGDVLAAAAKALFVGECAAAEGGGVYAVGNLEGGAVGPSGTAPKSPGEFDAYVARFAPDGTLHWSRRYGGPGWEMATSVIATSAGGALIAGAFTSASVDFGSPGMQQLLTPAAGTLFVNSVAADGRHQGTFTVGPGSPFPLLLQRRDSGFRILGRYSGKIDFDPGPTKDEHTSQTDSVFVSEYR